MDGKDGPPPPGRSPERAAQAAEAVPGTYGSLAGDLASVAQTKDLAWEHRSW
jgi:hypothetical protein